VFQPQHLSLGQLEKGSEGTLMSLFQFLSESQLSHGWLMVGEKAVENDLIISTWTVPRSPGTITPSER
jgi:hypothetical protein